MNSQTHAPLFSKTKKKPSKQDLVESLFQYTNLETAYDKRGKLSHVIAKLSKSKFCKLYGPKTIAVFFLNHHWLELIRLSENEHLIYSRYNKIKLWVSVAFNESGQTILSFFSKNQKLSKKFKLSYSIKQKNLDEEDGQMILAKLALKCLKAVSCAFQDQFSPIDIHIVPDEARRTGHDGFRRDYVVVH